MYYWQIKIVRILFILIIIVVTNYCGFTQNIFDLQHSVNYADYLFKSKEYSLAAEEYERILFLIKGDNDTIKHKLIQSYRYLGDYTRATQHIENFYPNQSAIPPLLAYEYGKLLILNDSLKKSKLFLDQTNNLSASDKLIFKATTEVFNDRWGNAYSLMNEAQYGYTSIMLDYKKIISEAIAFKYKSPLLSLSLSAIIPGLGKVYSGYWKDGLIALLFVSLSSWQAYRGFDQRGMESAYGWIYAGLATGFYTGNLYGSYKAARKYNVTHKNEFKQKIEDAFNSME